MIWKWEKVGLFYGNDLAQPAILPLGKVVVPKQPRSHGSIWPPSFGDSEKFVSRGPEVARKFMPGGMECEITLWHDVRPAQGHQKINVGRPITNAPEFCKFKFRFVIGQLRYRVKID